MKINIEILIITTTIVIRMMMMMIIIITIIIIIIIIIIIECLQIIMLISTPFFLTNVMAFSIKGILTLTSAIRFMLTRYFLYDIAYNTLQLSNSFQ